MRVRKNGWKYWGMLVVMLAGILLVACGGGTPSAGTPTVPSAATEDQPTDPPAEPTLAPTATPPPGKAVLISAGMDEASRAALSESISTLAAEDGLIFEERAEFQPADVQPDWRVAVFSGVSDSFNETVAANPAVQFILFTDQALSASGNLNVIRLRYDKQAFMAGYVATVITNDWRVGGLFNADPGGDMQEQAFINGGEYLCGLCNPYYAPLVLFPLSARISGSAEQSVWQPEVDALLSKYVWTFYVSPASESPALWSLLIERGVTLVGAGSPPEGAGNLWAASVLLDLVTPLETLWPDALAGQGGLSAETQVVLENVNTDTVTPGKQRLINETIQLLADGWLDPADPVIPVE